MPVPRPKKKKKGLSHSLHEPEKCDSRSLYIALSAFFFSFIEEKKNQKEELSGSLGCSALCGVRVRALPSTLGMLRIPDHHFEKG
ncbi:MAG: hypothetical protein IKZ41_01120, partial [Clostridia bacterium]|nr:hypothetical protein [Clostridia bacterium]